MNVRRAFIYIEPPIYESTQWAVFQPNEVRMTQDDIHNGRSICFVGVAPVRPAEFVMFRIGQERRGGVGAEGPSGVLELTMFYLR